MEIRELIEQFFIGIEGCIIIYMLYKHKNKGDKND